MEWAPAWNPRDLIASSCRLTGLQEREALAQFLLPDPPRGHVADHRYRTEHLPVPVPEIAELT